MLPKGARLGYEEGLYVLSYFSYDDGTEVTASKPDEQGNVLLYVEKFDREKDEFINATIKLPNVTIISSSGYSEEEIDNMLNRFSQIQDDIIGYVIDKENHALKEMIMKSATVYLNSKEVQEFIKRSNPYGKPKPLGVDLRAFLDYVDKNNIDNSSITPELVQKFAK